MIRTTSVLVCVLLGTAALSLPACSGSNKSEGPGQGSSGSAGNSGAVLGTGGEAGADSDLTGACQALFAVQCHQTYTCLSAAELAAENGAFGTSEADCPAALEANYPCTDVTACPAGQTFDSAQAVKCTTAIGALSCAAFTDPNATDPPECAAVCASPPASADETAACKQLDAVECKQVFSCLTADQLAQLVGTVGTTQAECQTNLDAKCATDPCSGATFDTAQAALCVTAYGALTCDQFNTDITGNTGPTECETVCH